MHLLIAINYPVALALCQMALVQDGLPKYLLVPEVSTLLHYVLDLYRRGLSTMLENAAVSMPKRTER